MAPTDPNLAIWVPVICLLILGAYCLVVDSQLAR